MSDDLDPKPVSGVAMADVLDRELIEKALYTS
jgi:hypothetical protein